MSISHSLLRRLSAVAAACCILVIAAPAAQAAVVGTFDPAFGPAIPNLGFRGTILLDVTPGCYALGGGFFFTGGNCQITAEQSQINFYNVANPGNVLTSVFLQGGSFAPDYVFGAYFDPTTGQLAGIDTNDSALFAFSVTDNNPNNPIAYNGSMVLYFESGQIPIQINIASIDAPAVTQPGVGGAFLRNCSVSRDPCTGETSNPASLTFSTVPEPDGIALAMLGLVALGVARRRKPIAR